MSYPNVLNYTSTNKITIQDVRETCQEESDVLQQNIIDAINEVTKNSSGVSQGITPLTQNITRAMGDYWFSIDGTIPPGGLPHLGHLVSRKTYGDFYTWLSSTKTIMTDAEWLAYANSHGGCCPYYSSGDGSTTFRTPKYDNAFLKTISSINGAGVYEEEGLPNITGETGYRTTDTVDYHVTINGAFATKRGDSRHALAWGSGQTYEGYPLITFDASRCSSVYGKSDTVTPKNLSFMIGVYAVGAIVPVGVTDAEKLMSGVTRVEGLLNSKLDNTKVHITETWNSSSLWYRKYSDGWIEQGGNFPSMATDINYKQYTQNLNIPFKNTLYTIVVTTSLNKGNASYAPFIYDKQTTNFSVDDIINNNYMAHWYACGY
jgi:hypothetical protein